jgi:phage protein D
VRNTPIISVSIQPEGAPKTRVDVSDRVLTMQYEDCEHQADKLDLTVDNEDLSNFDDPVWRKGNIIIISWGYPEVMSIPRKCQIRKVMGFKSLSIEALGLEVLLNVETKVRSFEGMSRSDVARQIANEWGYHDEALIHIQETGPSREHIAQARQTDAQMMRRLATKEGYQWYIDHDGFHFHERNFYQQSVRTLVYFTEPEGSEISDITIENDVTRRAGSVNLKTHDPITHRHIDVEATHENQNDRSVLGAIIEAPGKTEKGTPGFASIAHHLVGSTTEPNEDAAKRHAASHFRLAQQRAVKCNITMEGDPNTYAKTVINLAGVGKRLSQPYYLHGVSHSISGAYTMSLECISDGSGGHSTKSTLAVGASAVQVGPSVKGKKRGPDGPHRGIDIDSPKPLPSVPAAPAGGIEGLKSEIAKQKADLEALQRPAPSPASDPEPEPPEPDASEPDAG